MTLFPYPIMNTTIMAISNVAGMQEMQVRQRLAPQSGETEDSPLFRRLRISQMFDPLAPLEEVNTPIGMGDVVASKVDALARNQLEKEGKNDIFYGKVLVSVGLLLHQMYNASSFEEVSVDLFQFMLSHINVEGNLMTLLGFSPQASNDMFGDMKSLIRTVKSYSDGLMDSPAYLMLSRIVKLCVVSQIIPAKDVTFAGLKVISDNHIQDIAGNMSESLSDMLFNSLEFAIDVYNAVSNGTSMVNFFSPRTLFKEVSEILADEVMFQGQMLKKNKGITNAQYLQKIRVALSQVTVAANRRGPEKLVYHGLLVRLAQLQAKVEAFVRRTEYRQPPYTMMFHGEPGSGKTSASQHCIQAIGVTNNFDVSPQAVAMVSEGDKYHSTIDGNTNVIIIDDAANTKLQYAETYMNEILITFCNTSPAKALKADLHEKGTIPIEPKLLALTTNNPLMDIQSVSHAPNAGFRRIDCLVEVVVREEFRLPDGTIDKNKLEEAQRENPFVDFQEFYLCRYKENKRADGSKKNSVTWNVERKMDKPYSLVELAEYMLGEYNVHIRRQTKIVERMNTPMGDLYCRTCLKHRTNCKCIPLCGVCCCAVSSCICLKSEPIVSPEFFGGVLTTYIRAQMLQTVTNLTESIWIIPTRYVVDFASKVVPGFAALAILKAVIGTSWQRRGCIFMLWAPIIGLMHYMISASFGSLYFFVYLFLFLYSLLALYYSCYLLRVSLVNSVVKDILNASTRNGMAEALRYSLWAAALVSMANMLRFLVKNSSISFLPQLANDPITPEEFQAKREEKNEWISMKPEARHVRGIPLTMTQDQVIGRVSNNVVHIAAPTKDGIGGKPSTIRVNGIFTSDKKVLIPLHFYERLHPDVLLTVRRGNHPGTKWDSHILKSVQVSPDAVLCVLTNGPSFGSIREFFSDQPRKGQCAAVQINRDMEGDVVIRKLQWNYRDSLSNGASARHWGSEHVCTPITSVGDCGGLVISLGDKMILGYHVAGDRAGLARSFGLLGSDLSTDDDEFFVEAGDMEAYTDELYSSPYFMSEEVHPHAITRYLKTEDIPATLFGSTTTPTARIHSDVKRTPMSPFLEMLGNPCLWGPPRFNFRRNTHKCFVSALDQMRPIEPSLLTIAAQDYAYPIVERLKTWLGAGIDLRGVLTISEAVNGREGAKFIRMMNVNTSAGLGLSGTKKRHLLEFVDDETGKKTYLPTTLVREQIERTLANMRQGLRTYPPCKGALKDEPTKLMKDGVPNEKVRVFFVMQMHMIIIGRMYLCPILEVLQMCPQLSECYVGVQATTGSWGELYHHVTQFGENSILAGDYSQYDQKITDQLIHEVARVFLEIARTLGYSRDDLHVLRVWFAEMANPMFDFGQVLVMVNGYNPSGSPVTVNINSVVNSLLHRCFYYDHISTRQKASVGSFRKYVALATYGDDSLAGRHSSIPWFNMRELQFWLRRYNMTYTDPKKSTVIPELFHIQDVEFCKRSFRWEFRVDDWVAPLQVDSIWKSVHCMMATNSDEIDICIQNMVNALREGARHDEHTFDGIRELIVAVASDLDWLDFNEHFHWSYDRWWDLFRNDFSLLLADVGSVGDCTSDTASIASTSED